VNIENTSFVTKQSSNSPRHNFAIFFKANIGIAHLIALAMQEEGPSDGKSSHCLWQGELIKKHAKLICVMQILSSCWIFLACILP
jgi:hypothetical protein